MNYKLLVIDVDDTLLTDERKITEATKQALRDAMHMGVSVTLATGRMFPSAKQIARQLQLDVPLITYQGSLVKHMADDRTLYERWVPLEAAEFLIQYASERDLHIQAYASDQLISRWDNDKIKFYAKMTGVPYHVQFDFHPLLTQHLTKLLLFDEPETLDAIRTEIEPLLGEQVYITKSKPYFLEFLHKEGTKGHAVRHLAEQMHCGLDQVIAIGDSWNDHEMLSVAGLGIAMDNAVDSLKQIADYITRSNNEEGVKHVVDKFILNL